MKNQFFLIFLVGILLFGTILGFGIITGSKTKSIEVGENQISYKTQNGLTVSLNPVRQIHYGDRIEACYIMNYSTLLSLKTTKLTKNSFSFKKSKQVNSVITYPILKTELVKKT